MKCAVTGDTYTIFGYKGKQVRDNIHSYDLVSMFAEYIKNPRAGEVYNTGGSRYSNCSMKEAVELCEKVTGNKMNVGYSDKARNGDHIWYISSIKKFKDHYPNWNYTRDLTDILEEIFTMNRDRWLQEK